MAHEHVGEWAALATAVLWTLSALAWTSAGKCIGALAVSFLRLLLAVFLLMLYGYCSRGLALPSDAAPRVWFWLGISGFLGFFVSDLCLFKAFLVIGPRLSLLVTSLTPPFVAVISWAWRGEGLGSLAWLAMGVTLSGVLWVVLEQREDQHSHPHLRRESRYGLILAGIGTVTQSFGMVLAKDGISDYDPAASALIRILGALVGYFLLITVLRRWRPVVAATRKGKAMWFLLGGTIVGPCVGVSLCMLALQHCHEGVVTTILATIPVMILPFSIYLFGEKVSVRAVGGALVAVAGVALLMFPVDARPKPEVREQKSEGCPWPVVRFEQISGSLLRLGALSPLD
jgi:drug/metabolite transporter (DMT)-like permease